MTLLMRLSGQADLHVVGISSGPLMIVRSPARFVRVIGEGDREVGEWM